MLARSMWKITLIPEKFHIYSKHIKIMKHQIIRPLYNVIVRNKNVILIFCVYK